MFEQAILQQQRRPWTLAASLTLQSAAIGAGILLSIITIDRLPGVQLPVPLPPFPAAPRAVEIVAAERTSAAGGPVTPRAVFLEPTRIPRAIANIIDEAPLAPPSLPFAGLDGTGLPPGLYTGTPLFSAEQLRSVPPPAPVRTVDPPAPKDPKMVRLGGNVMEAKLIRRVIPEYPKLARDMRISGVVRLAGIIGRDGTVRDLKVVEGHPLLVAAAVAAVRQWLYSPTLLNGEPVEVLAPIEVKFTLSQ
jgi:protein TonB